LIDERHIVGELGELLAGKLAGRRSPDEVTLFKSLGIAVEDLAAVHYIHEQALARGVGLWVDIGGRHYGSA
jgi:ornithine cyclodeaminase